MSLQIVTCPQWRAVKPSGALTPCKQAARIVFHHTAGHHAEITNPADESLEEAIRYAQDIQRFHMEVRGWLDSGHNFLVCRNGVVLQGRWLTVSMIEANRMVISAHCPGQNDQIGIEHEHVSGELPTTAQLNASAGLMAWIAKRYGRVAPLPVQPHSEFFATACPDNLVKWIPEVVARATAIMAEAV